MKEYTYSEKAIIDIMACLGRLGHDVAAKIETPLTDESGAVDRFNDRRFCLHCGEDIESGDFLTDQEHVERGDLPFYSM